MTRKLSVANLTLITVCSVDSIRNLPAAALAGSQLFTYFTLALLFFLLPCALIAIWFSEQSQQGIYGWVKKGLGQRFAFMAVWFQCLQNVLIYPTFLSFIAGTLLYNISPELVENRVLLFIMIISLIWALTWVNLKGIALSSRVNTWCSITGLLIPFAIILLMGLYWWLTQTHPDEHIIPQTTAHSWGSLTAITLSFCGIELAAVHAQESKPGAFSKSIVISVLVVFVSMLLGSLTLAMIIPAAQLNFISSIPQLIQLFFTKMHCAYLAPIINVLIAIGCIGAANNWLIAPIKGLSFAATEGFIESRLTKTNKNQAPAALLIIQAASVTVISSLFLMIPLINNSYWIMLNAATQILLLMYLLMFSSAIKLSTGKKLNAKLLILIPAYAGSLAVFAVLIVSLIPPPTLQFGSQYTYALFGVLFLISVTALPFWKYQQLSIEDSIRFKTEVPDLRLL